MVERVGRVKESAAYGGTVGTQALRPVGGTRGPGGPLSGSGPQAPSGSKSMQDVTARTPAQCGFLRVGLKSVSSRRFQRGSLATATARLYSPAMPANSVVNAFSIDVEDYFQVAALPCTARAHAST